MATIRAAVVLLLWLHCLPLALCLEKAGHISGHHSFSSSSRDADNDPFRQNHLVKISWDDPTLWGALGGGRPFPSSSSGFSAQPHQTRKTLTRRADDRTVMPGSWPQAKHCLGCRKETRGDRMEIGDLTTDWLVDQILLSKDQMKDRCVFYTGVPNDERAVEGKALQLGAEENLSAKAAAWACNRNLVSLWTLYPGRSENVAPPGTVPDDSDKYRNFWEISVPNSWLKHLDYPPVRFWYFENMSEAMARRCSGRVWVYSLKPRGLANYGTGTVENNNAHSIWNSKEFPELKRGVGRDGMTQLVGVDANTGEMWDLDMNDLRSKGAYSGPVPRGLGGKLEKRNTCLENLNYQTPGEDWFGTGRRSAY